MSAKWATTTIGEVAKLVSGRKPPLRAIARGADLPFLSAKVMRGTQSPEYGDPNHRDSVVANADDLVIICTGSNSGEVFTGQAGIVASTMAKIDVKPHIDSTYLRYFLKWNFSFLNSRMKGMAIPSLDRKLLSALTIPVPPLAEQKRITRTLDEAFERIAIAKANAEKNLRSARAIFENHLQAVFQRGGDGWTDKALEEVCQFSNGLWKGENPPYERVGVIRNTNFTKDGTLDDSDIAFLDVEVKKLEKRRLKYGDIILEKSGGGPKQAVGRVILFEKETGSFSFSNFTAAMRVLDQKSVYHRFLHKFLFWMYISGATENMQSNSTGIRNLNGDAYKAIRFSFPSYSEQRAIAALIDKLQENTNRLAQINVAKMAALEELQESLLHQAFSGKLKAA